MSRLPLTCFTWLALTSCLLGLQFAATAQLTCNISISQNPGPNCTLEITLDDLLEDPPQGSVDFTIEVFINNGNVLVETLDVTDDQTPIIIDGVSILGSTYTFRGRTLLVTATDNNQAGNNCTVQLLAGEDNTAPTIACPTAPITINCFDPLSAIALPLASDNCDPTPEVRIIRDFNVSDYNCGTASASGTILSRIVRAFDDDGNFSAECEQFIRVLPQPDVTTLVDLIPASITFTCEQFARNPGITDQAPLNPAIVDVNVIQPGIQVDPQLDTAIIDATGAGTTRPLGGLCDYMVIVSDDTLAICGAPLTPLTTFKIIRDFTIMDNCNGTMVTGSQIIQVMDMTPPVISIPSTLTLNANAQGVGSNGICRSTGLLPAASITSGSCAAVDPASIMVFTPVGEALPVVVGGQTFFQIPALGLELGGPYTITYTASNTCGTSASATVQVTVVDNTPPIAVCDEITNLSLTTTPNTAVFAASLDDGSTDQCGQVFFKVLRMDELLAGNGVTQGRSVSCNLANSEEPVEGGNTTAFDDEAFFCCDDIATNNNMVVVRVFDVDPGSGAVIPVRMNPGGDLFGRFNDCMVEVQVEDKLPPLLVLNAPTRNLLCTDRQAIQNFLDETNLTLDPPVFVDACDFTVSLSISNTLDKCDEGTITRSFVATDSEGNQSVVARQTINVTNVQDYSISFPTDIALTQCGSPAFNDTLTRADIDNDGCALFFINRRDQRFSAGSAGCFKILRRYRITNCCVTDLGNDDPVNIEQVTGQNFNGPVLSVAPDGTVRINGIAYPALTAANNGFFEFTQVITVADNIPPIVTAGPAVVCDPLAQTTSNGVCGQATTITFSAVDACSANVSVDFTLTDLNVGVPGLDSFGVLTNLGGGNFSITGNYPLGSYTLNIQAFDDCSLIPGVLSIPITISDCTAPTAKALNGVAVDLMITGMVACPATRIDNGSFDACGGVTLLIKRATDPRSAAAPTLLLDCDDLGLLMVDLIVVDDAGNEDFVRTFIDVQDNLNACSSSLLTVAGNLSTASGNTVAGARVTATGGYSGAFTSAADGNFSFDDVPVAADLTLNPSLTASLSNGVTTFDGYLIGQHVLGVQLLDSPEKILAADMDNSQSISAYDITLIRRVVLGLQSSLPNGQSSWRFVDANHVFPQPSNPWAAPFPEVISYNDLSASISTADFTAIKVGDVNNTAQANSRQALAPRTVRGEFALEAADAVLAAGETAMVAFSASDATALGYQLTIEWDADALEVVAVNGAAHTEAGFGTHLLADGKLTLSHDGEMAGELFSLEVRALRDGVALSEVLVAGSSVTAAEAYGLDGDRSVALRFSGADAAAGYALEQNRPNPFAGTTRIAFTLAEAGQAALTVTDIAGRVVWRTTGEFSQGRTEVEIAASELPAAGVLSYTLTAGGFSATRKLVVIE